MTALKILQGKEIVMNDWDNNGIDAFTNVDDKIKQNSGMAKPKGSKRQFGNILECKNAFEILTVEDDSEHIDNDKQGTVGEGLSTDTQVAEEEVTVECNVINEQEPNRKDSGTQMIEGKPELPPNNHNDPQNNMNLDRESQIVIIGDSIIKHIITKKISSRNVTKITFPGKTADEISNQLDQIKLKSTPSHIIIHAGTNNLPVDTAETCAEKVGQLASNLKTKFPTSRIGISSIVTRDDCDLTDKIRKTNSLIAQTCLNQDYGFINNENIDRTALNGSKIHLNAKGSAYLAVNFIKFIREGNKTTTQTRTMQGNSRFGQGFQTSQLLQLGNLLTSLALSAPQHPSRKM